MPHILIPFPKKPLCNSPKTSGGECMPAPRSVFLLHDLTHEMLLLSDTRFACLHVSYTFVFSTAAFFMSWTGSFVILTSLANRCKSFNDPPWWLI